MFATPTAPTSSETAPSPRNRPLRAPCGVGACGEDGRGLADVDLVGRFGVGGRGEHALDGGDLAGHAADVDRGRVTVEAEVGLGGGEADEHGAVDLRGQDRGAEDPGDVEPLPAQPDALAGIDAVDAEPLRGSGAEHRDRLSLGRRVEVGAAGDRGADGGQERERRRLHAQRSCLCGGDERAAVDRGARAARVGDLRDGADASDHPRRCDRELCGVAGEGLAGGDGEQVGAEPVDLGEQPGLRGGREAEHRHDRRDADRDAERREPGAQPSGAHADAGDAREVGQAQLPGGRAGERLHVCCPGGRLTSANAAAPACLTMALTT